MADPYPCDCLHCREVAAMPNAFLLTGVGPHKFNRHSRENEDYSTSWRWRCPCTPRAIGRWQTQSPNVSYHDWRVHAGLPR